MTERTRQRVERLLRRAGIYGHCDGGESRAHVLRAVDQLRVALGIGADGVVFPVRGLRSSRPEPSNVIDFAEAAAQLRARRVR